MAIQQVITIESSPSRVYSALLSTQDFGEITGAPAEIAAEEGGAFSCFGGQIVGRQLELSPDERIVQAWRAGPWPDGAYSIVRFDITEQDGATTIRLEQVGYPEGAGEHLEAGWHKMYWEPLKAYLE